MEQIEAVLWSSYHHEIWLHEGLYMMVCLLMKDFDSYIWDIFFEVIVYLNYQLVCILIYGFSVFMLSCYFFMPRCSLLRAVSLSHYTAKQQLYLFCCASSSLTSNCIVSFHFLIILQQDPSRVHTERSCNSLETFPNMIWRLVLIN